MRSHPFIVILTWCKLAPHVPHFGPDHDAWIEHLHRAAAMQPHRAVGVSPYNAPLLTEARRGKQPSISVHVMTGRADRHPGPDLGTRQLPTNPATVLMYRPGSAAATLCVCNIHRGESAEPRLSSRWSCSSIREGTPVPTLLVVPNTENVLTLT